MFRLSLTKLKVFFGIRRAGHTYEDAKHGSEAVTMEVLRHAVGVVATEKGVSAPAEGNWDNFWKFVEDHWAEILAVILKLIGL